MLEDVIDDSLAEEQTRPFSAKTVELAGNPESEIHKFAAGIQATMESRGCESTQNPAYAQTLWDAFQSLTLETLNKMLKEV